MDYDNASFAAAAGMAFAGWFVRRHRSPRIVVHKEVQAMPGAGV